MEQPLPSPEVASLSRVTRAGARKVSKDSPNDAQATPKAAGGHKGQIVKKQETAIGAASPSNASRAVTKVSSVSHRQVVAAAGMRGVQLDASSDDRAFSELTAGPVEDASAVAGKGRKRKLPEPARTEEVALPLPARCVINAT